jgi:addiction module HigA family antidote
MDEETLTPIHPGEILREEYLVPMGLSANALAGRLGVTAARVNEIVKEKRGITADTALRLAKFFSTTPEFWMNLQKRYELECARREIGEKIEEIIPMAA